MLVHRSVVMRWQHSANDKRQYAKELRWQHVEFWHPQMDVADRHAQDNMYIRVNVARHVDGTFSLYRVSLVGDIVFIHTGVESLETAKLLAQVEMKLLETA